MIGIQNMYTFSVNKVIIIIIQKVTNTLVEIYDEN